MGIILASSSPRRKKILEKLGYNFDIKIPDIDENNINNLDPIDYVIDVSMRKGLKVHQQYENAFVLSGDTIVEFQNKIPTAENIVIVIYDALKPHINPDHELAVTLYETPRNFVRYEG